MVGYRIPYAFSCFRIADWEGYIFLGYSHKVREAIGDT